MTDEAQVQSNNPEEMSRDAIWRIARREKWMVISFLFSVLFGAASAFWILGEWPGADTVGVVFYVLSAVFALVFYIALGLLAQKLHGTGMALVAVIASLLVPLIALLAVVVLAVQANRTLKARNVKVGLLGPDMSQFSQA